MILEMDRLNKIEDEINSTKKILVMINLVIVLNNIVVQYKTIDQAIQRGEKLEDLMMKSQDISDRSKVFLKEAKKANRCCVLL